MARLSGLRSDGSEVSKGSREVENKEPEVSTRDHHSWTYY